ncbi:MAG: TonB-dependent receptor [Clostridium sp.]|nr:TonB-dependent receptor [Clostridium sp.]
MRKIFYPATLMLAASLLCPPEATASTANAAEPSALQAAEAETGLCSGSVVDETGEPLIGASVIVEGTQQGVSTNIDGKFTIPKVKIGSKIRVSYVGYKEAVAEWTGSNLNITLAPATNSLDEVVVVGFGVQKKADLTGAVSQVKMEDVVGDRPVINAAAALQGAIPGLMISGGSGPGQSKSLKIRGDLSLNGGSPLVLIDNVEGDIAQLSPDDIESVTVLKDASASAIYGARAAGGVVLITTKRPKDQAKFNITYGFNQGWERSLNRPEQASLSDYIKAYREAGYSAQYWAGNGDLDTWEELLGQYRAGELTGVTDNGIYKHTDGRIYYLKESDVQGSVLGTGALSNHNISMSGATDRIRFRLSANYSRENGPMVTDKDLFIRKGITSFVSGDITSWFTQELSMFYTNTTQSALSGNIRDPFALRLISYYPTKGYMPAEYLTNSDEDLIIDSPYNSYLVSPTSTTTRSIPRIQSRTILKPLKNWTITAEYTYNQRNYDYRNYTGVITYADVQLAKKTYPEDPTKDTYTINRETTKYNAFNLYTNYNFDLKKNHFEVMLGFNQERYNWAQLNTNIQGQAVTTVPSFGGGTGQKNITENYSQYTIRGGFGRINYNYDERYLLSFSGRYDGSSKFPKSNRFGFFPSASGAWRIGQESFMEGTRDWLDELKVRFSYGSIGNQNIDPYGYVANMSVAQSNVWLDGGERITYITVPGLIRANYTWETVKTYNAGLDFMFLNARLQGSFEWYRRSTEGMLAAGLELPSTVGASAPLQNVANMRTDGWELSLSWRDRIGDWGYRVGLNLYDHRSKITKFDNKTGDLSNWYPGRELNQIWGYISDGYYSIDDFDYEKAKTGVWELKDGVTSVQGVNVRPGDMKYVDLDGDGIITTGENTVDNPGDRKVIGNSTSRLQFGVNAGVNWKGIDLDIMLQGVGKRDYWLGGSSLFPFGAGGADGVFHPIYYNQTDYWTAKSYDPTSPDYMVAANPDARLFRIYDQENNVGYNTRTSDKYLQNASYLRIKNITLGYTFPAELTRKVYVEQFRLFCSVENLHTFTSLPKGFDPENMSWTYPFYRTWSFGATITF